MTTTAKKTFTQVFTQIHENYGAHSWDGEGECPSYWKAKGGTIFVLQDDVDVEAFSKSVERADDYFTESVIGVEVVEDPSEGLESWESPTFVSNSADGFLLDLTETSEHRGFHPQIAQRKHLSTLGADGTYNHILTVYSTVDGEMIPASKVDDWLKENEDSRIIRERL